MLGRFRQFPEVMVDTGDSTIETEFFLHTLNFGVRRLIVPDVEFPTNHVGDENGQRLGGSTCGANGACEMNRNELGTIDVVEQTNLTDAFQRGHKNGLGQHSKTDTEANIDGFLQIITRISEPAPPTVQ